MLLGGKHKDRWLLTYADFITLLFATFVLMYATAKAKEQRPPKNVPVTPHLSIVQPPPQPPTSNLLKNLQTLLTAEQQNGLVTLSTEQRGIVIALDDRECFGAGQADVQSSAVPVFEKVADILSHYDNRILLEGHTDSIPIHNGQFRSNWELSMARSIGVMELMEHHVALRPERFLIGGSAENAPVSSNGTEQGRGHNRRVEIIVLDSPSPLATALTAVHPISFVSDVRAASDVASIR